MEIHRTRGAPLKDYILDEQKTVFFRVRMLPLRYVGFCKKISRKRQKRITFKKKFIKKYLFVEEIRHFQEQKNAKFSQKSGTFSMGNQWKLKIKQNRFPLDSHCKIPGFWENLALFCS